MPDYNNLLPLTPDLNAERLETLKQLLPDLFTNEGRLNTDELRRLTDPDGTPETERYEFRWFGKTLAKRTAFTPSNATLVRDANSGRVFHSARVEAEAAGNFIIEGENLEVLKLLLAAYRQRVKCIYIDPPYNTGKDFVYSDNYTEDRRPYWENTGVTQDGVKIDTNTDADGRYHSNWLNMLYSRLLLARQLLRPDGVIFISIDDNEVTNLRKMCDEVFGEENFVAEFIWKSRQNKDNRTKTGASIDHEYIICYSKFHEERVLKGSIRKTDQYSNPDNDERGSWVSANMVGLRDESQRPNLHYDLIDPETKINYGKPLMGWRYDKKTMSRLTSEKRIIWPSSAEGRPRRKVFFDDVDDNLPGFSSMINQDVYTRDGTSAIENLLGSRFFDFPKPPYLIKSLIEQVATDQNDLILDFFAGSGTTGQAVMELNAEDGGNRQFILVQIPEATDEASEAHKAGYTKISDITIERCRRVAQRLAAGKTVSPGKAKPAPLFDNAEPDEATLAEFFTLPEFVPEQTLPESEKDAGKVDEPHSALDASKPTAGFQVMRLRQSYFPRTEWTPDPAKSDAENEKSLREYIRLKESQLVTLFNREELISEILLKQGFLLNYSVAKAGEFTKNDVFRCTDGEKEALVCLDNQIYPATMALLFQNPLPKFVCLERTLDTTQKWNLKHTLQERFYAF